MIRINLLLREKKRKKIGMRKEFAVAIASIVALVAVLAVLHWRTGMQREETEQKIATRKSEIAKYEAQIAEATKAKEEQKILQEKLNVINALRKQRSSAARVLDVISVQKPEKIHLESVKKDGTKLGIEGIALDDETVANFMTNLRNSRAFRTVDLIVSEQSEVNKIKLKKFTLSCEITPM